MLARYADSEGYEKDPLRSMWPYRDWVINALNTNMPFDQFTIEQLAGDLLPKATDDDRIATGFHRNTMINTEGGVDPEEYRVVAVIDRVNTTATVWLGTTLGCCQCHSHKYDPFKQNEYYQFLAFFNNTADTGSDNGPEVEIVTPTVAADRAEMAELETKLNATTPEFERAEEAWRSRRRTPRNRLASQQQTCQGGKTGQGQESRAGKEPDNSAGDCRDSAGRARQPHAAAADELTKYFRSIDPDLKPLREQVEKLQKKLNEERVTTLVMQELPNRAQTQVFTGGSFLNPGEVVSPACRRCSIAHEAPARQPPNRLALARWLVDPENPLTSRVRSIALGRSISAWGSSRRSKISAPRANAPTHPELLDWLATEFIRRGWDMKAMQRLIVTSATYRQTSRVPPSVSGTRSARPAARSFPRGTGSKPS